MIINTIIKNLSKPYNFLKNFNKFNFNKSYKNNIGSFRYKTMLDKITKYRIFLYLYIFITLWLCPYLDNLFFFWYASEANSFYLTIFSLIFINFFINFFISIPTKNTLNFKLFFLKLKSFFYFVNDCFIKFLKLYVFFKNEIFFKSFLFNFLRFNFVKLTNYFVY